VYARYEEVWGCTEIYRVLGFQCCRLGRGGLAPGEAEEEVVLFGSLVKSFSKTIGCEEVELTIGKMVAKTLISSDVGVMWWCQS